MGVGPTGATGATGVAGAAGATGATGGAGSGAASGGLLAFTGAIPVHVGAASEFYLANPGGDGAVIAAELATAPLNYPIPSPHTFRALAVRIPNIDAFGSESSSVTFTVLKNGAPTALTVTFDINTVNMVQIATADVSFDAGDRYDLQMVVTSTITVVTNVSAGIDVS